MCRVRHGKGALDMEKTNEARKYYLSPAKRYDHGCRDYAIFEDRGDGTAVCVTVESCSHRIHGLGHEYAWLGEIMEIERLISDRDYVQDDEDY